MRHFWNAAGGIFPLLFYWSIAPSPSKHKDKPVHRSAIRWSARSRHIQCAALTHLTGQLIHKLCCCVVHLLSEFNQFWLYSTVQNCQRHKSMCTNSNVILKVDSLFVCVQVSFFPSSRCARCFHYTVVCSW